MSKKHTKPSRWRKALRIILIVLLALAVAVGGTVGVLYLAGKGAFAGNNHAITGASSLIEEIEDEGLTVTFHGDTYRFNENVVTVLCLGVDKKSVQQDSHSGSNGQADSLFLLGLDTATGATKILPISREIMAPVDFYSPSGTFVSTQDAQICLSYAYGATGEESCKNVMKTVSRLLYFMDIDAYMAIDLDGVAALSNAVGGVPVTAIETLKDWHEGDQLNLKGNRAVQYIQGRGSDLEANLRRQKRQKQFLDSFLQQARAHILKDPTKITTYYNTAKRHIVTDLTLAEITYLATKAVKMTSPTYLSIEGETVMGEEYVEFRADEESLLQAALDMYYIKEDKAPEASE